MQRPLAIVVIGGLITCTLLTLIVVPVLYRWFENAAAEDALTAVENEVKERRAKRAAALEAAGDVRAQ